MTNEAKFEEVFGFKPDTQSCVIKCPEMVRETACPYFATNDSNRQLSLGCYCEDWWKEEFKVVEKNRWRN